MKTLTCKMCGSTYLIKEDDMYLCKSCGTKYSIADIEGENMPKNIKIDPEILKQEAERQEELKRLRKLVKDDPTLYERIFELDYDDWEAYYYHYTVKFKFIYESDDIDWKYLSQTFDRLKKRVSSDSEIKTCIKDVIYKDFKEWADSKLKYYLENYKKERIFSSSKNDEESSWIERRIVFCSKKMNQLKNHIISIFGENFSDFADELKNDFDKLSEQRRSDIYKIKEEKEEEIRKWKRKEEEEKRKWEEKEEKRKNRFKIGVILMIIGIMIGFGMVAFDTAGVIGIIISLLFGIGGVLLMALSSTNDY